MTQEPPNEGRISGWLTAVKGLTISNALVIVLLIIVLIPAYFVYRALGDPAMLDKFLSHYRELPSETNCTLREARQRGGPETFSVSTGFAYQGSDRWIISVLLNHSPDKEEMETYCATLNIIVDNMHDGLQ